MHDLNIFKESFPEEVKFLMDTVGQHTDSDWNDLFSDLLEITLQEGDADGYYLNHLFKIKNFPTEDGSWENAPVNSQTYVDVYNQDREHILEFNFSTECIGSIGFEVTGFECYLTEEYEKKLNKTVDKPEQDSKLEWASGGTTYEFKTKIKGDWVIGGEEMANLSQRVTAELIQNFRNKEEKTMSKLRTVNITLIDENPNLKGDKKVVFQKMGVVTEFNDQETKMNIIATGKVAKALQQHNAEVREQTIDKGIQRTTGRDVMLEPIELLSDGELTWNIIQIA